MSKPTALHAFVSLRLDRALGRYVDEHALGAASAADSGFLLARAPDSVRAPDVWFIRRDRIPVGGPPDAFWTGAPDLAVEVRSKNDRWPDILEKVDEYFAAGTQLVWVIEPIRREVVVFRADMPAITLMSTDELDGQDVVPGFHLPVRDLFE
jgi:Uma2 family endonuclease